MTSDRATNGELLAAVTAFRDVVAASSLPLDLPSTARAKDNRVALLRQLEDYVIPRLSSIDAPLLAVIGGSTGAGKSTLVNSILRREVSKPGVIRPTTTSPVLIHHPRDAHWFTDKRILPGLARVTGDPSGPDESATVRLVTSEELPPGMALLDAPDIRPLGTPAPSLRSRDRGRHRLGPGPARGDGGGPAALGRDAAGAGPGNGAGVPHT